jgi:pimeloyl-ACP methyl ester carboxylesterase
MKSSSRDPFKIAGLTTIGVAGATLALAGLNRIINQSVPPLTPPLHYEPRTYVWEGGNISYTVRGQGPAVILLHGIYAGASSFEFRQIFYKLSRDFRVYAPDLPGFGLSERRPRAYHPNLYVDFIYDFTRQVAGGVDNPVHLVATSLTGSFAVEAAADRPDLFESIVLIEPVGIDQLARHPGIGQQVFGGLLRSPILGNALYNLIVSRPSLRAFLSQQVYAKHDTVTDDMVDTYYALSHQPNAQYATASFIDGSLNLDISNIFTLLPQSILLCWGRRARVSSILNADAFLDRNPNAELMLFDQSGGLPHDEEPDEFVSKVARWLHSNISSRY